MVLYPAKRNEFEIHADLYSQLRHNGLNIRGEIRLKFKKEGRQSRKRGARFDLVLFDEFNKAVAIIEVKDSERKTELQEHVKAAYYEKLSQLPQFTFFVNDSAETLSRRLYDILNKRRLMSFKPHDNIA